MSQPPYGQFPGGQYPGDPQPGQGQQPGYGQYPGAQPDYGQQPGYGQYPGAQPDYGQQPGYGQYDGFGSPQKKGGSGKLIAIVAGAVVLVGVVALVLVLTLSGGRGAKEAAEMFVDAVKARDTGALLDVTCPELDEEINDQTEDEVFPAEDVEITIGKVEENGDTATVEITLRLEGEKLDSTMKLEKNDDGDFEVCDFNANYDY